ncbi:MAG: bifunctional demethylmenaquinone methyltransferase/2-methoxy-6-polyprenyl-1,4-benzoquinol methylase UbiE [Deltaproteobacteria bacterium]|uniref:Demethylmenaquinone methyltransferase n=1 Tax=Candidatus Zymogenus saltonus TaxID=2844893 RepID=A0A9D8KF41_9DELT|nr:bifunctional demethylmenaquinone methyltransferase/2-methoxy-6-polyprenyl-1,4-benzoquinol methylase UbiE [Candidatus Zymogenus saltonus]
MKPKSGGNISALFDDISRKYDFLNRVLSFNADIGWRRKLVKLSGASTGDKVLDVCAGTGDIGIELATVAPVDKIFGVDFSLEMLKEGSKKIGEKGYKGRVISFIADALNLPFGSETFNVVTIGFGLRNLTDYRAGISEMTRVLKGGGRLMILEFAMPERKIVSTIYGLYLKRILPIIGGVLTGKKSAYDYLSDSIAGFLKPMEVIEIMRAEGLVNLESFPMMAGTVYIYRGEK